MGKVNKYILVGSILTVILSTYICYHIGWTIGFAELCKLAGYTEGYNKAISTQDEAAFVDGCNRGIQEIVESVCNSNNEYQETRRITFQELITFLKTDKTDEIEYSDNFTCIGYALTLKQNATNQGIKCAFVVLNYEDDNTGKKDSGHTINAFDIVGGPPPNIEGFADNEMWKNTAELLEFSSYWEEPTWHGQMSTFGLTTEEAKKLTDYYRTSGIIFVEPQSDEIVYGITRYTGSSYHLLSRGYIDKSGKLIQYRPDNLSHFPRLEMFTERTRRLKTDDRIIKVEQIW